MMHMAYDQPRTQTHPAQTAQPSVEQWLRELHSLADKGYITQPEYRAKKQTILDSV